MAYRQRPPKYDGGSPTAQQIAWTLTNDNAQVCGQFRASTLEIKFTEGHAKLQSCLDAVTQNRAEWISLAPPPLPEIVRLFEQRSNELIDRVSKMDEAAWNRTAQFYYNGKVGQLSAYLRPMAIYGPSADARVTEPRPQGSDTTT